MTTDKVEDLGPAEERSFIRRFSQRIIKERSGNYKSLKRSRNGKLIYDGSSGITSNRGNKLLQGSELVTREHLNPNSIKEEVVYYNGSEHRLLQRMHKRMNFFPDTIPNSDGDEELEELDLNKLVDVREILTPIYSLSDVAKRSSVSRTYKNNILQNLSLQTILMIEKEQNSVIRYNRMLEVFLGDYPEPLYERNLKLKDYNHNLTLPEEEEEKIEVKGNDKENENINSNTQTQTQTNESHDNTIDNENNDKTLDDTDLMEEEIIQDEDPFFTLPDVKNTDGLKVLLDDLESSEAIEQMETTRQMAQIALQRNQEFIRNLKKIRNFMDNASRIRERILAWSKEYAGIPEDDVTVPNALRVVKRGIISATTNKSMGNEENDSAFEGEEE